MPPPDGSSKYCFKHSDTLNKSTYCDIKTPTLSAGYEYTVAFKAYGAGGNKWCRFNVHDSEGEYISKTGCSAKADCWTEFSFTITPEADGWYVGFLMNNEIYIDDFKIINKAFEDEIIPEEPEDDEPENIAEVGDVNNDGEINIIDLVKLKKDISCRL